MVKRLVQNLLHKELSYQIHGAAIEVRKDFGPGHKEKLYQKAFEEELKRRKISFDKELAIKIYSPKDGKYIGLYRPDFSIDKKIIVEIKAERFVNRDEIKRIYDYLRNSEYELAYLINFASPRLFVKRIIYTNDHKPFYSPPINTNTKLISTKTKKLLVSIGFILVLFSGLNVEAAEISFSPASQSFGVGQIFETEILLDTQKEDINAIEGTINFPNDLLNLKEIRDSESIVSLWIEKPKINDQYVSFAGIIPGGYTGEDGKIFSLVFQTKKAGENNLIFQTAKALLNDSKGTTALLTLKSASYKISETLPLFQYEVKIDKELPEPFQPEITHSPEVFNGKYFLVFNTQDKISGIDYYEVKEGGRQFEKAESPYLLKNQWLYEEITVRAVDKAGNIREARIVPLKTQPIFLTLKFWLTIIGGILGIAVIGYVIRRLLKRKNLKN